MDARHYTNKFLEMIEEGLVDKDNAILMCVKYMSEHDVEDMMDCNELSDRFLDDEEDESEAA